MTQVFKESEYYSQIPKENPFPPWEHHLFNGVEGLRADFGNVVEASKNFPIRSTLTVIGFLTMVYIGFKISKSFVKIGNRLRG